MGQPLHVFEEGKIDSEMNFIGKSVKVMLQIGSCWMKRVALEVGTMRMKQEAW